MALELLGKAGPQALTDGALGDLRLDRSGAVVAQLLGGRFREAVARGNVYHASVASAGVAPGTAIGATAAFVLYNPAGSGKNLVVLRTVMAYVSGTLGSGTVYYCGSLNPVAAAVTGSALTAVNGLIGSGNVALGQAKSAATLPASPTIIRPFCTLTPILATTAVQPYQVLEENDGEFVVAPGAALSLEAVAGGGSTPLVVYGMMWEEVPA